MVSGGGGWVHVVDGPGVAPQMVSKWKHAKWISGPRESQAIGKNFFTQLLCAAKSDLNPAMVAQISRGPPHRVCHFHRCSLFDALIHI